MKTYIVDLHTNKSEENVQNSSYNNERKSSIKSFLKKNFYLGFAFALFVWAWILVYAAFVYKPTYTSQAKIIVRNYALTASYLTPQSSQNYSLETSTGSRDPVLNTLGLIQSSSLVDDLWVFFKENYPNELKRLKIKNKKQWIAFSSVGRDPAKGWCKFIKVKNITGTDIIIIQFSWDDPKVAKEALDVVIESYQDKVKELSQNERSLRRQYIDQQVKKVEEDLKKVRKKKSDYKAKSGLTDVVEESKEYTINRLRLVEQINSTTGKQKGAHAEVVRYQKLLGLNVKDAMAGTGLGQNTVLKKLQDELYLTHQQKAELDATLTEKHPKVQELQSKIDTLKTQIEQEVRKTVAQAPNSASLPAISDLPRGEIVSKMAVASGLDYSYGAEIKSLQNSLKAIDEKMKAIPVLEESLSNIEQNELAISTALSALKQQQLEAHLKENEAVSNLYVADPPLNPMKPTFPRKPHILLIGFIVGIIAGLTAVVLVNLLTFLKNVYWVRIEKSLYSLILSLNAS